MQLSILIATQGRRNEKFVALVESLIPQADDFKGDIEIVAYWNNGEKSIGEIRQALVESAKGAYVCFIDDDDKVPAYYCTEIMKALGEDYVGFEVELFEKDRKMPKVFHSIRYGVWHQDNLGFYRGITHLNPIKREIALKGTFGKNGIGEDAEWALTIMQFVRTETYIDKIMYYYLHDADDTSFGGAHHKSGKYKRPVMTNPCFRYHPDSKEAS